MRFTIQIGADPEVFMLGESGGGGRALVPGWQFIQDGARKGHPAKAPGSEGLSWHPDNVTTEYNFEPLPMGIGGPSKVQNPLRVFSDQLRDHWSHLAQYYVGEMAPSQRMYRKLSQGELEKWADEGVAVFGCDPEFNAWDNKMDQVEVEEGELMRYAGGHIHIGLRPEGATGAVNPELARTVVKFLDCLAGLGLVQESETSVEEEAARRVFYGKAGAMRLKEYGVEWRVPSNSWLFTRRLGTSLYQNIGYAIECATIFPTCEEVLDATGVQEADIRMAIDTHNPDLAAVLFTKLTQGYLWRHIQNARE